MYFLEFVQYYNRFLVWILHSQFINQCEYIL